MPTSSRDRFLTAVRGGVPDRVPVAPDISNYIPAKRTGLPFWAIYFEREIPLWRAYLEAADHFGIDPWIGSCCGAPLRWSDTGCESCSETAYDEAQDAMVRTTTTRTPHGDLVSRSLCFRADPPSPVEKPIKDLARDWPAYRATLAAPAAVDEAALDGIRRECRARDCAFGVCVGYPGFQSWSGAVEGGVEQLAFATIDHPAILDEWCERDLATGTKAVELLLATDLDYLTLGGSGTITLASPELARRYALPAIKRWSAMCREAGVATVLHSCGKSRVLVDMLAQETDVDCVNPLEVPPMGDVDLAEVKRARGAEIALMGNLHTTGVMLRGTADEVYAAGVQAIRDAGQGGGFVLSTGDQCGRDTPDGNLFALVRAAEECGVYAADGSMPGAAAPQASR